MPALSSTMTSRWVLELLDTVRVSSPFTPLAVRRVHLLAGEGRGCQPGDCVLRQVAAVGGGPNACGPRPGGRRPGGARPRGGSARAWSRPPRTVRAGVGRPGSASYAGTPDRSACSDGISDHSEGIPHAMAAIGPINAPIAVVWTTPRGLTASQSAVSPAAAAHMTIIRR